MPSFDTVLEPDLVELRNAVEQSNKEIGTRFDFKGSDARVDLADKGKERTLTLFADSDFQLGQVRDVLLAKLSKRGVDVRFADFSAKPEKLGGEAPTRPGRGSGLTPPSTANRPSASRRWSSRASSRCRRRSRATPCASAAPSATICSRRSRC
jgi:hypothetical protein